jgi:hypothetical protein
MRIRVLLSMSYAEESVIVTALAVIVSNVDSTSVVVLGLGLVSIENQQMRDE